MHARELPPGGGGDTEFANMYNAYESLDDAIKRKIAVILSDYSRKFNGKYTHGFIIETKDFSYAVAADDISVGWTLRRTGVYGEQELECIKN